VSNKPHVCVTLTFDPEEMARRGRIGAYARLAKHDARELTARARQAFLERFDREVDPNGILAPEERARRAAFARKAHFARLARLSAIARSKGKTAEGESSASEEAA
jgi:hypothetical protein